MIQHFSHLTSFLFLVRRRFKEDRCVQFSASLTYTTLLSLVPIVAIALTLLSAFPVFTELMTQLKVFILINFVPTSAGKIISVYMQQFSHKAQRLTELGIGVLAVTAFVLMLTIEHAFNVIWRVHQKRPLLRRLLMYGIALTLGPLMIGASLSLTSYLVSFSLGLVSGVPGAAMMTLKILPVTLTILAFSLFYMIVPSCTVSQRHALIGGVVAGLSFELMKKLFALYVSHFPTYTLVYGAFASVPLFLIWIYLSWLIVLSGAVIVAALPYWGVACRKSVKMTGGTFFVALGILRLLYLAQHTSAGVSLKALLQVTDACPEEVEDVLEKLCELNWVKVLEGGGWALNQDVEHIRLADVYRVFVFDAAQLSSAGMGENALLANLKTRLDETLSPSLKEFFKPA